MWKIAKFLVVLLMLVGCANPNENSKKNSQLNLNAKSPADSSRKLCKCDFFSSEEEVAYTKSVDSLLDVFLLKSDTVIAYGFQTMFRFNQIILIGNKFDSVLFYDFTNSLERRSFKNASQKVLFQELLNSSINLQQRDTLSRLDVDHPVVHTISIATRESKKIFCFCDPKSYGKNRILGIIDSFSKLIVSPYMDSIQKSHKKTKTFQSGSLTKTTPTADMHRYDSPILTAE